VLNIFQKFYNNFLFHGKFNKEHYYWLQLRMLIPNFVKINPAAFKMRCGNIGQKETPASFILHSRYTHK